MWSQSSVDLWQGSVKPEQCGSRGRTVWRQSSVDLGQSIAEPEQCGSRTGHCGARAVWIKGQDSVEPEQCGSRTEQCGARAMYINGAVWSQSCVDLGAGQCVNQSSTEQAGQCGIRAVRRWGRAMWSQGSVEAGLCGTRSVYGARLLRRGIVELKRRKAEAVEAAPLARTRRVHLCASRIL